MKLLTFLKHNIRSLLYATFITAGFGILIHIITFNPPRFFVFGSLILYVLLVLELVTTRFWANKKLEQLNIPIVDRYDQSTQLILHLTIPSLTFWAFCLFIISNLNPNFWIVLLFLSLIIFSLIFINIRAYYEDKFRLEKSTHYVYDFIKLLVYGLITYSIFFMKLSYEFNNYLVAGLIFLLSLVIMSLNLVRYKHVEKSTIVFIFLNSLIISLISLSLLAFFELSIFKLTLLTFILFYIGIGVLHHKNKGDLSKSIVVEYIVVALLALSTSVGI